MVKKERVEKDFLGSFKVPSDAFFGIQTMRAFDNFQISGNLIHPDLNDAIVMVKLAAAQANMECGVLDKKKGRAIVKACHHILSGRYDDQFVLDVFTAGAGTPYHMNVNEVIANAALEILGKRKGTYSVIDPHNHVNYGQSTNDVIPTAMRISSYHLSQPLVESLKHLINHLNKKAKEFRKHVKAGRTHQQDAVPITLGAEFAAWSSSLSKRLKRLKVSQEHMQYVSLGGSAVGTGLNVHPKFTTKALKHLTKACGFKVKPGDKIEHTQFQTDFLELSSVLREIATDLVKIGNDLIFMSSGPVTGIGELSLPAVEPGSSIMPAKVNPSIVEMMQMVCFQVIGNDLTIQQCAQHGRMELNVYGPVLIHNLLESLEILGNGIWEFTNRCVRGIKANEAVLKNNFEKTPSAGTVLSPILGYDQTALLIKEALRKRVSVKEVAVSKGLISKKEADRLFSVKNLL